MVNLEGRLGQIMKIYPRLRLEPVRYIQQGQYNEVLIVRDSDGTPFVFRFPRYPVSLSTLQRESALLITLQNRLPLPVPNPVFQHLEAPVEDAFMGYKMLPGVALNRMEFRGIEDEGFLTQIARQLASFLQSLHQVPLSVLSPSLEVADRVAEWAEMYARVRKLLFRYMRPDARAEVAAHFESYLGDPGLTAWQPVLRHGDFGLGNILFDGGSQAVTGVIDFAFAGPGDRATDLAAVGAAFGASMLRRVLGYYPVAPPVLQRLRFYQGTFALFEALFGLENGDEAAFEAGMASYI